MTDDRFERGLHEFLRSREPGDASPGLRVRVAAVPVDVAAPRRGWTRLGTAASLAAAILVALALGGALVLRGELDRSPGAAPPDVVAPGQSGGPFIVGATAIFSAEATATAERRLAAVYAATGVETTLVVRRVADRSELALDRPFDAGSFDHDGSTARDLVTVIGVEPRGTVVCCLSFTGDAIGSLDHPWRPLRRFDQLTGRLQDPSQAVRDEALAIYVTGVEELAPRVVAETAAQPWRSWVQPAGVGLLLLAAGLLVTLRRRATQRVRMAGPAPADDRGGPVDGPTEAEGTDVPLHEMPTVAASGALLGTGAVVPWSSAGTDHSLRERTVAALVAAGAIVAAVLAVVEGLAPTSDGPLLDPSQDGLGLVAAAPVPSIPVVPILLLAAIVLGLAWLVWRRGRLARSIGGLAAVVAAWAIWSLTSGGFMWVSRDSSSEAWVDGLGFGSTETASQLPTAFATYPVAPGEATTFGFAIQNRGPLPISVLGAGEEPWTDGMQSIDQAYRITGLGRVGAPTHGPVERLSARPEDARVAWPVRLEPGQRLVIVALGRGGPCAAGTGSGEDGSTFLTNVRIVYRVMGWTQVAEVAMPTVVAVPQDLRCAAIDPDPAN